MCQLLRMREFLKAQAAIPYSPPPMCTGWCVCIVNPAHHMVATYPWVVRNAGGGLSMLDMLGMPRYVVQGLRSRSVARSLLVLAYRLV